MPLVVWHASCRELAMSCLPWYGICHVMLLVGVLGHPPGQLGQCRLQLLGAGGLGALRAGDCNARAARGEVRCRIARQQVCTGCLGNTIQLCAKLGKHPSRKLREPRQALNHIPEEEACPRANIRRAAQGGIDVPIPIHCPSPAHCVALRELSLVATNVLTQWLRTQLNNVCISCVGGVVHASKHPKAHHSHNGGDHPIPTELTQLSKG